MEKDNETLWQSCGDALNSHPKADIRTLSFTLLLDKFIQLDAKVSVVQGNSVVVHCFNIRTRMYS